MRCGLALLTLAVAHAKSYIRRSHAIVAGDGSIQMEAASNSMPVYTIYFEMDGHTMCWQRESDGCRSSRGDCDISYCNTADGNCQCLLVGFQNCSSGNSTNSSSADRSLQLYTETMKFEDGGYPSHSFFWRRLRVKYYDNTEWDDRALDRGKALESSFACESLVCNCSSSKYFNFAWESQRLIYTDEVGTKRSIGPSPLRSQQSTLTLRIFNQRLQESRFTTQVSQRYRTPTSTTTTTTTNPNTTTTTTTMRPAKTSAAAAAGVTTSTTAGSEEQEVSTTGGEEESENTTAEQQVESTSEAGGEDEGESSEGATTSGAASTGDGTAAPSTTMPGPRAKGRGTTAAPSTTATTGGGASGGATTTVQPGATTTASKPGATTRAPTPGAPTPAPTPGATTPAPTPGAPTPAPTPGATTPAPTPGAPTPAPTPGATTPAPTPGAPTPAPTGATTPAPTPGAPTPTPGATTPAPTPGTASSTSVSTARGAERKDEDEGENWGTSTPAASTTSTTTLFCYCYVNVSWRPEARDRGPVGVEQKPLRRATVPQALTAPLGGCRKFCVQDDLVRAVALHKGYNDYCTCYTPDLTQPLYEPAWRHPQEATVISNWSLPKTAFHGYTKVVTPHWNVSKIQARSGCPIDGSDCSGYFSGGCGDKKPIACDNTHQHSPYATTLPLEVRAKDSFHIEKVCTASSNVSICTKAWLVFDLEEKYTVTKIRLWNYATDEGVRRMLLSAGNDLNKMQDVQVFREIPHERPTANVFSGVAPRSPVSELLLDVPVTGRFMKMQILENYGGQGAGFYRAAFEGYKSPFEDFLSFTGKSCGGYELEDLNGQGRMSELFCRALCSSRLDCAAFEVIYSGKQMGHCIFHSNIWIPTKALNDDRNCFVKDTQVVYCQNGLPFQDVCCSTECGVCGGDKCSWRFGGRDRCCAGAIRAQKHFCRNTTDVACRIPKPRRAGMPTLRLTFERNGTAKGNESDIIPKSVEVSKFQASTLSRAGGTAADLTGVNTGITIKGYQEWFSVTSTFMCWIQPSFKRAQSWYFIFRTSGYTMHAPQDGSWAVEFQCKEDKARLMIWTRQPAGLGAVATEYKAKRRWEKWTHIAVVLRVGGTFPQLFLNGQPEELEDATTPWSELEDIVYRKDQYLIIGQAADPEQQFDGYLDHFEVYEEVLSPEFIRKHYGFVEAAAGAGDSDAVVSKQVCLPPIDTTGYVILQGSASRASFQVDATCDAEKGFGGEAKVTPCSSTSKRYVLGGCLRKEQCPLWMC